MTEDGLLRIAEKLTKEAGQSDPRIITPLAGGRNNRVFRVDLADGSSVAMKCYFHNPRDTRDRLFSEWSFLSHVWRQGVRSVPRPLAKLTSERAALYQFVAGSRAAHVTSSLVEQAAAFIIDINPAAADLSSLSPASEACFSINEHVETIERRVKRLVQIDASIPGSDEAQMFVASRLIPAWNAIRQKIGESCVQRGVVESQRIERLILSPSDFGFHNAIIGGPDAVTFLDFEYAGFDDPAKLICDFFCQPELPVPVEYFNWFCERLAMALDLDEGDIWRSQLLLDAYRVKWVCIMLNEFLPVGAERRRFAVSGDVEARTAAQLRRAERYIDIVSH